MKNYNYNTTQQLENLSKAEYFKNKINSTDNLDEKKAVVNYAKRKCEFDFGKIVSKLKFEDGSILEINTKLKAKILK